MIFHNSWFLISSVNCFCFRPDTFLPQGSCACNTSSLPKQAAAPQSKCSKQVMPVQSCAIQQVLQCNPTLSNIFRPIKLQFFKNFPTKSSSLSSSSSRRSWSSIDLGDMSLDEHHCHGNPNGCFDEGIDSESTWSPCSGRTCFKVSGLSWIMKSQLGKSFHHMQSMSQRWRKQRILNIRLDMLFI